MNKKKNLALAAACLLATALGVRAETLTYRFTAVGQGPSYGYPAGGGPPDLPPPYSDGSWPWQAPISGTFTLESTTPGSPASTYLNGANTVVGSFYANAVTSLTLDIRDQHFEFVATQPPGAPGNVQSFVLVSDLPFPSNNPATNYDGYSLNVPFGSGLFADPYGALEVSFSLSRTEHDLNVIRSTDMVDNLVYTPGWSSFFSIYDRAHSSQYQIYAPVTSLEQTPTVPLPGALLLFSSAGALLLSWRRRTAPRGVHAA